MPGRFPPPPDDGPPGPGMPTGSWSRVRKPIPTRPGPDLRADVQPVPIQLADVRRGRASGDGPGVGAPGSGGLLHVRRHAWTGTPSSRTSRWAGRRRLPSTDTLLVLFFGLVIGAIAAIGSFVAEAAVTRAAVGTYNGERPNAGRLGPLRRRPAAGAGRGLPDDVPGVGGHRDHRCPHCHAADRCHVRRRPDHRRPRRVLRHRDLRGRVRSAHLSHRPMGARDSGDRDRRARRCCGAASVVGAGIGIELASPRLPAGVRPAVRAGGRPDDVRADRDRQSGQPHARER